MQIKKHSISYKPLLGAFFAVVACSFAGTADAQLGVDKGAQATPASTSSTPASAAPTSPAPVESAAFAASPSYRLIGTIGGKSFAGAVFDDPTGAQSFSRLYDKLSDGSQIINVYDDRITLKRPDGSVFEMYTIHDTAKAGAPATKAPVSAARSAPASAPAPADYGRPVERSANVARSPRMAADGAQRGARNADDGEKRAGRGRRNKDAGGNAGLQGADPRGSRARNRDQ